MRSTIISLLLAAVLAQDPEGTTAPATTGVTDAEPAVPTEPTDPTEPTERATEPTPDETPTEVDDAPAGEPAATEVIDPECEPAADGVEVDLATATKCFGGHKVTHIAPMSDRNQALYVTQKDFSLEPFNIQDCKDPNPDIAEHAECFCRLQSDPMSRMYTGAELPHPKPYTAPFFGTNFCQSQSIDSPTCCNKMEDEAVKDGWLIGMPQDCLTLTEKNKDFAWILKDISCMTCSTDQRRFLKKKIITLEEPEYEQLDPECKDGESIAVEGLWLKCARSRKVTKTGKYKLQELPPVTRKPARNHKLEGEPDGASFVIYVCENFAREFYRGLEENNKTPRDEVQLDMIPQADYDECSYFNFKDDEGEDLEEPEEITFMTDKIKNIRDLLNANGIATLAMYGIEIEIFYDDMGENEELRALMDAEGWGNFPQGPNNDHVYCFMGNAASVLVSSVFAASAAAMMIFN